MKISFGAKILIGFIINILLVVALLIIYVMRTNVARYTGIANTLDWLEIILFVFALVLLIVVFIIIQTQIKLRREADKLLLANRELILSIINNTSNPISIKKINGEYLLVNQRFISLFQVEGERVIGKTDEDILPKETAEEYRHADLEVIKQEKEIKVEEKIFELDGEHTYLSVKFPLFDASGRIYAVGSIGTDITDRKTIVKSLKDSEAFFKMSLEIMVIANKEKFLKVNPALSNILGYPNKDILEKSFMEFIYPPDHDSTLEVLGNLLSGVDTVNFENRWVTADKKIVWLSWTATSEKETGLIYAVGRDVTEKKKAEEDLKIANTFFDLSYDLMVVAKDDYFVKVNAAFSRILGYNQEDMSDQPFLSFAHPSELEYAREMISKVKKGEPVVNFRARARTKDKNYKILDWTITSDIDSGEIYAVARDVTEMVKKEESLLLVNNFFENSMDAFFVVKDTKIIKTNPAFTKITGYTLDDVDELNITDLIHVDYKETAVKRLEKRLKGEEVPERVKYPVLTKNGNYKWMETMVTTDTESGYTYAVLRDIDEMVKNEEFLKIADTFFNLSLNIMVILDDETFIRVNPTTTKVLGYSEKELLTQPITTFIYPEDVELTLAELKKLNNGTSIIDFKSRWICKDTTVKWLTWTFTIDKNKKLIYGVANDISEKLQLEQEEREVAEQLRENEQRLRLILDNIGDGVIVANAEKKILLSNYMADELIGEEHKENRSANLSDKFYVYNPSDESVFPAQHLPLSQAFEGVPTDDIDVLIVNRESKERRRVLLSGRPLADQNNNVVAAVVTIRDITRYKRLEEELEKSEKKLRSSIGFKKESE